MRWIPADDAHRIRVDALRETIRADRAAGDRPIMVVGAAGTVATGAVDPIRALSAVCREESLWFHVDGAYGAPAACCPTLPTTSRPWRWPTRWRSTRTSGCMRRSRPAASWCVIAHLLAETFGYHPTYYHFETEGEEPPINYYELGLQNSRGFRALKVWLAIRQAGRDGYIRMIGDDCRLAGLLYQAATAHPELEALSLGLSIATFRYVPADLDESAGAEAYLDELNEAVLARLKTGGEMFVTNAVVGGHFALRACIVNFRTTEADIAMIPEIVARTGRAVDAELRPAELRAPATRSTAIR